MSVEIKALTNVSVVLVPGDTAFVSEGQVPLLGNMVEVVKKPAPKKAGKDS